MLRDIDMMVQYEYLSRLESVEPMIQSGNLSIN